MITHYDLFAGIGGFSLALDKVFYDEEIKHIFCEWEQFPTAVLKKHWPNGEFWGDIAELVTHTQRPKLERGGQGQVARHNRERNRTRGYQKEDWAIVTGGFPCQPFSAAGRRRGTSDDRYKWPEMFEVIRNVKPAWVIAENVRGLVTWDDGMVLEQICTDLESQGYEVQPIIIPAVAVNAPHRRDRVWIIAHAEDKRPYARLGLERQSVEEAAEQLSTYSDTTNSRPQRRQQGASKGIRPQSEESELQNSEYPDWGRDWQEVAFATCDDRMDDGLPRVVDGVPYSRAKWRRESLKAYGNAIVPQVAMQVMQSIKEAL